MDLSQAIKVFVHGFTMTRSFAHLYIVEREDPLIILRDAPRTSGDVRSEEVIVHGLSAESAAAKISANLRRRYRVCVAYDARRDLEEVRAEWKAAGFRALGHEPFFIARTDRAGEPDARLRRVETADEAERFHQSFRRQILPEHRGEDDAALRLYAAWSGDEPVGIVRSIRRGETAWVSNLYVRPDFRRQGLAGVLMRSMLADDARLGVRESVLLTSSAGVKLYPSLGYERIGTLQIFSPVASDRR